MAQNVNVAVFATFIYNIEMQFVIMGKLKYCHKISRLIELHS